MAYKERPHTKRVINLKASAATMLTTGAVVVACFAVVSGVVQLIRSYSAPLSSKIGEDTSSLTNTEAAFYRDRSVAFGYEIAAILMFVGNGVFWLASGSTNSLGVCSGVMDKVTSTVAILSALAFVGSLGRYFAAATSTLVAASSYALAVNAPYITHLCGAVPSAIAVACLVVTSARVLSVIWGFGPPSYTRAPMRFIMLI